MAYIAASLRQAGHTVLVVDGLGEGIGRQSHFRERYYSHGLTTDEIVERIDADTELIGIGIMFSHLWPIAKVLIGSLRARFPHAVIVCGGEHVTALPRFVMEDAPIDYAVIGEGEETLMELAAHLGGLPERLPLDRIAGLAYRCAGGSIASTPPRRRRRALDEIPWPAWDLFPLEGYLDTNLSGTHAFESSQRPMVILSTRGCPYTCKSCSNEQIRRLNYVMRDQNDVGDY